MVESNKKAKPVRLLGYSERGMVNALCDDITYSNAPLERLEQFLSWNRFPLGDSPDFSGIVRATILVEQSFSDFGDLDLLILLDHGDGRKQAVLVEAKVHTDISSPKSIEQRWRDFNNYLSGNKKKRSNLFVQLYRKLRLIQKVKELDTPLLGDGVARRWSLGSNRVVRRAAKLLAEYQASPWFVALVPDSRDAVTEFFGNTLAHFSHDPNMLPDWNTERWGYVTWPDVELECDKNRDAWQRTRHNFEWNREQIYRPAIDPNKDSEVRKGTIYRFGEQFVLAAVSRSGQRNCRVVPMEQAGEYFPISQKVSKSSLRAAETVPDTGSFGECQPQTGKVYLWDPPGRESPQPSGKEPVPEHPKTIKVTRTGCIDSKVQEVDDVGHEVGAAFHVFTHHLRREEIQGNRRMDASNG